MASASQLMALVQSYVAGDDDRFLSVALQVAAHEARLGHGNLATELRKTIDEAKRRRGAASLVSISKPQGQLANLLQVSQPDARLSDLILDPALSNQIERVIREQREATIILEQGLSPRRKLLLVGPPGTGKTLTASVLAGELGLPLLQVRLDGLITRFMGETAAKLRQIFDATGRMRGVYLFDEFDAIGSGRGLANDVGEIRRVVNSFLVMIEQDSSRSLVIAATNHPAILAGVLSSMRAPMKTRGNNPKRRIVPTGYFSQAELAAFAVRARYEGSALHKLKPADYGFHPPANPRASKSACDDIRIIKRGEASDLLKAAFLRGMVSACEPRALPKYAWAVDADREAYEAKLGREGYHGYRLGKDDREMRDWVIEEWLARMP